MIDIIKMLDELFLKAQLNDHLNVTEYCFYYRFHLIDIELLISKDGRMVELTLIDIDDHCNCYLDYEQRRAYKKDWLNNKEYKLSGQQFIDLFIDKYESVTNMLNNFLKYC